MKKLCIMGFSLLSYIIGMASIVYLMLFFINFYVPKSISSTSDTDLFTAIISNIVLLSVFYSIHSVMARPSFKKTLSKLNSMKLERSNYILVSGLTTFLMVYLWSPVSGYVWHVEDSLYSATIYALYTLGWLLIVLSTFNLNHFSFFGLEQPWRYIAGHADKSPKFTAKFLYSVIRHPISLGWMVLIWATPNMTYGHLLFAIITTLYIFIVTPIEEMDIERELGSDYREYKSTTNRFIPSIKSIKRYDIDKTK